MTSPRGHRRSEFSAKVKGAALKRCIKLEVPRCENCDIPLNARTGIHFDHIVPDGLGGQSTLENCQVLCFTCHDIKTVTEDNPRMAKADRVFRANHGQRRRKGPPMPGSRDSGFKRTMDGRTVRR